MSEEVNFFHSRLSIRACFAPVLTVFRGRPSVHFFFNRVPPSQSSPRGLLFCGPSFPFFFYGLVVFRFFAHFLCFACVSDSFMHLGSCSLRFACPLCVLVPPYGIEYVNPSGFFSDSPPACYHALFGPRRASVGQCPPLLFFLSSIPISAILIAPPSLICAFSAFPVSFTFGLFVRFLEPRRSTLHPPIVSPVAFLLLGRFPHIVRIPLCFLLRRFEILSTP